MNKKEIAELRRRINIEKHNISCIRGCYVNEKREIVSEFTNTLSLMPEEETEKFLQIFKKSLSGSLNRNLVDIGFSTAQVEGSDEHKLLMTLRSSALKDDESVSKIFSTIIGSLEFEGSYLILLMSDIYDVPVRGKDGRRLEDSSSQFSYIMCCICPVKPTKSALGYNPADNGFRSTGCDYIVASPEIGFLFPAFDNRATNIYSALYYTRNSAENHKELTDAVFHAEIPKPADEQRDSFCSVLAESLEEECSYKVLKTVHTQLSELISEHEADKTDDEPLVISKGEVNAILESCGVSEEHINSFAEKFDEEFGSGTDLIPQNLINSKFEIHTENASVRVAPDRTDSIETRIIDGVKYILIRADEAVEVNGITINISED